MLSTSVVKSTSDASHYYSAQDNYYTKEEGIEQSEWYGKGAARLNLSGEIEPTQFTALLKGVMPNGEQLGKVVDGIVKHRTGWDLTFSAPKSVSILALVGGDKRLIDAHRQAVKTALSQIERSASEARIKINGDITYMNTKNMVAALYHHDLSREQDPQLHTHSVVLNMTERPDGKWRSQASKIGRYDKETSSDVHGFIERVRNNKRYFGKLYEAELCYQVNQLGYKTAVNPKTGVFEIVDVSKEVNEHFSKRRQMIEKSLAENGFDSAKAADVATIKTRQTKRAVDRVELKEKWKSEAAALGLNCESRVAISYQRSTEENKQSIHNEDPISQNILESIKNAAKELSQFKTTFLLEEIVTLTSEQAIRDTINVETLLKTANYAIKSGDLIPIENDSGKTVLMAKSTLQHEKNIIACLTSSQEFKQSIKLSSVDQFLEQSSDIQTDTKRAIETIFSNQQYILVEGDESRESLIKPLVKIAQANGLKIAIVSPNQLSSNNMATLAKTKPTSLWDHIKSFFTDTSIPNYSTFRFLQDTTISSPDLLLVDKSHLLSTQEVSQLIEWGNKQQKQVVFFGNNKVLLSQKQGKGLSLLLENGMQSISLAEQKGSIKDFVSQDDLKSISQKILSQLIEIAVPEERLIQMAKQFSNTNSKENLFLMANNKKSLLTLNELTHSELKKSNQLGGGVTIKVLLPVFVSESQAKIATLYQNGNIIRFNEDIKSLGISRGGYFEVISQNKANNEVILRSARGKHISWQPDKDELKPEIFKSVERELCAGERIQFHRSLQQKNILKGEHLSIKAITQHKITLINDKGRTIVLSTNDPKHLHIDYGYAATPHQLAYQTPTKIIAELPHRSFHTDKRQFFQMVSQPQEVVIYTDNKTALIGTLARKSGDRLSAHEVVNHSEMLKQNLHSLHDILVKSLSRDKQEPSVFFSPKAADALDYAVKHLSEREASFSHKELMLTAMQYALGKVSAKEFEKTVSLMEKENVLIRGNRSDGTLWTTLDAVNSERQIISLCHQDKGKFQPMVSLDSIEKYCDPNKLTSEQVDAIKRITQSEDRILVIQGRAGTGKTTLMTTLEDVIATKDLLNSKGYQLLGLAPTHPAVKELTSRGIPAQTLDSFLLEMQKETHSDTKRDFSRTIVVLDEASMVSNKKMHDILKIAHESNFRQLIPVGDIRQLASIEAGKPHALMQKSLDPIKLETIRRQENETLKEAVKETYRHDFAAAFNILKNSIIEIGNPTKSHLYEKKGHWEEISSTGRLERIKALVSDYAAYPPEQRGQVLVITPGHEDRILTNTLIRDHLKQEGSLLGREHVFSILTAQNLTQAERSDIRRYRAGQVIRFSKSEGVIKAGEYCTIEGLKIDHNLLVLKNTEGKEILWQLPALRQKGSQSFEVFKREERSLQVGDSIRWSRTDKSNHLYSSETAKVTTIQNNEVTLEYSDKKRITVDPTKSQFQHWDYNYALTVYAAQGATKKTVLALLESYRENLIHQPAFLVALTRAVDTFRVYTDNIAALLDRIEQNSGVKLSSLETIGELKKLTDVEKKISPAKTTKKSNFDKLIVEQIVDALNQDAEKISTDFLGKPASRTSNYLQFGSNKGSLRVVIQGTKQGLWNDFSGEYSNHGKTGGNMFQFLQIFGGMTKKEALEYGAQRFGFLKDGVANTPKEQSNQWKKESEKRLKSQQKTEAKRQENRIQFAKKLANESISIGGTLAEKYLKEQRGITLDSRSHDIRFHSGIYSKLNEKTYPAMLVIARDKQGEIKAVQATYLDPSSGKKIDKNDHAIQKQTFGVLSGSTVTIKGTNKGSALVAEGVETGLSLAQAFPEKDIKIILGKSNFLHIDPKDTPRNITFCLDNDGKNIKEDKVIYEASKRLVEANKHISLAVPQALGHTKQDYNDIAKIAGISAVKSDAEKAIPYSEFYGENIKYNHNIHANSSSDYSNKIGKHRATSVISNEKIQRFASDLTKTNAHYEKSLINSYRTLSHDSLQKDIHKDNAKSIQTEREI